MTRNEHLPESIYDLVLAANPEIDDLVRELIEETAALGPASRMQLGTDQAAFLGFLVGLLSATNAVEVGTFTGLSSLYIARSLPPGGRLLCCDVDEQSTAIARRYWERAGVADRISLRLGPAAETLATLSSDEPIDLAFIDADKAGYVDYYELLVPRLAPTGVIVADNVFIAAKDESENAAHMREFVRHIRADDRTETVIVSIGDGFSLSRRRAS